LPSKIALLHLLKTRKTPDANDNKLEPGLIAKMANQSKGQSKARPHGLRGLASKRLEFVSRHPAAFRIAKAQGCHS